MPAIPRSPIAPLARMALIGLIALSGYSFADPDSDDTREQRRGNRPPPDLSETAITLGISEDVLHQALRNSGDQRPDLALAAGELGIDVDTLRAAMPARPERRGRRRTESE